MDTTCRFDEMLNDFFADSVLEHLTAPPKFIKWVMRLIVPLCNTHYMIYLANLADKPEYKVGLLSRLASKIAVRIIKNLFDKDEGIELMGGIYTLIDRRYAYEVIRRVIEEITN